MKLFTRLAPAMATAHYRKLLIYISCQKVTLPVVAFLLTSLNVSAQAPDVLSWDRTVGGAGTEELRSLALTPDGGYLLGGYSNSGISGDKTSTSFGGYDFWIAKVDGSGNKGWNRSYGASGDDRLQALIQTSGGGFLLGGSSNSFTSATKSSPSKGGSDYWVVKVDGNGNRTFDKSIGGAGDEQLQAVIQTSDGGFLLGGYSNTSISGDKTSGSRGWYDYWVVKLDGNGNKLWDRTFGGSSEDRLQRLVQTSDGGYLLGGYSNSGMSGEKTEPSKGGYDFWVVRVDHNGNKLWDKTIGGVLTEELRGLVQTPNGGFLLGGYSTSDVSGDKTGARMGESDYWVVKLDGSANKLWDKTVGGNSGEQLQELVQAPGGGYVLGGWSVSGVSGDKTEPNKGSFDYWMVKLDDNGGRLWDRTIGGTSSDVLQSLIPGQNGGYVLGGYSNSPVLGDKSEGSKGLTDYWITRTLEPIDPTLLPKKVWDMAFGGSNADVLQSMIQTSDGGFLLGGYSGSGISGDKTEASKGLDDYWVVRLDRDGNKLWDKTIGGSGSEQERLCLVQTPEGGFILGTSSDSGLSGDKTEASKGGYDYWVVRLDPEGNKLWDRTFGTEGFDRLQSLCLAPDGGFLLGGSSGSGISGDKTEASKGLDDYWVVRLDRDGNKLWDRSIGGSGSEIQQSLIQTSDGGYLLGGYSNTSISGDKTSGSRGGYDYWVVKLDSEGNKLWDRTVGGSGNEEFLYALAQTLDGGYVLGANSGSGVSGDKTEASKGLSDYWVIRLDGDGNKLWDRTIGGNGIERLQSLILTSDGGYLLGGYSYSRYNGDKSEASRGLSDYWVVRLDENGNKVWDKTIGGDMSDDNLFGLAQASDGGFILGGNSTSNLSGDKTETNDGESDYGSDYWLVKIFAPGEEPLPVTWVSFEGRPSAEANSLAWATASESGTELFVVERSGDIKEFISIGEVPASGNSSQLQQYTFMDAHLPKGAVTLYYRLKQLDLDGRYEYSKTIAVKSHSQRRGKELTVYPNPFGRSLSLLSVTSVLGNKGFVSLYGVDGRKVFQGDITPQLGRKVIFIDNLPELAPGVYFLNISLDGETSVYRLVK